MLARNFDPFITAKENGMGFGLALCERIVHRMDGDIDITNAENGVIAEVSVPVHVK